MGRMIDGQWTTKSGTTDKSGRFVRAQAAVRNRFRVGGRFPPESGRYHVYVAHACPWAHRVLIVRALRQLENHISVEFVHPFMGERGWAFSEDGQSGTDSLLGKHYLHEIYRESDPSYTGPVTTPTVWDKKEGVVVNNESREIIRDLNTVFMELGNADVCLAPPDLQAEIDARIDEMYESVNNGVYKAGFARSQEAHEDAVTALFDALDEFERKLEGRRFLVGDQITEADVCLFVTLFRFDLVYHTHFKCNLRRVLDYPNLWRFVRRLYAIPEIKQTCDIPRTKEHYYRSHASINPHRIVPLGPDIDFDEPIDD